MFVSSISPSVNNFKPSYKQNRNIAFGSAAQTVEKAAATVGKSKFFEPVKKFFKPVKDCYGTFVDWLAGKTSKILETDFAKKAVEWTNKHPIIKNNLFAHLFVVASTLLTGLSIKKTLDNDKLDSRHKKTLAINQAAVWGVSTVMAYTFDKMLENKTNQVISKFKKLNKGNPELSRYIDGIRAAKSIMVVTLVYRYIAPVVVTPIANWLGNKLEEKEKAKAKIV